MAPHSGNGFPSERGLPRTPEPRRGCWQSAADAPPALGSAPPHSEAPGVAQWGPGLHPWCPHLSFSFPLERQVPQFW